MIEPSALVAFEVPFTSELTIVLSANIKQFGSFLFARHPLGSTNSFGDRMQGLFVSVRLNSIATRWRNHIVHPQVLDYLPVVIKRMRDRYNPEAHPGRYHVKQRVLDWQLRILLRD